MKSESIYEDRNPLLQVKIRKTLKKDWLLESQPNSHKYQKFVIWGDGSTTLIDGKGRYFTLTKMFLTDTFPEHPNS